MFLIRSTSNILKSSGGSISLAKRYLGTANSKVNTTKTSVVSRKQPSIYEILRRKRDRAGLVNVDNHDNPDIETVVFPRERLGLNYDLNWALNGYSITPLNQAYRNAKLKMLLQHSKGTTNNNNVLTVQQKSQSQQTLNYYLEESLAKSNNSSTISLSQYKSLLEKVKDHISQSQNIYVQDSAIGSHRSNETLIRVVTNDAFSSLYLKHLLPNTVLSSVKEFKHPITLYLTPDFNLSSPETFGLKSSNFNILDVKRGIAVISGVHSTENIKSVLNSVFSSVLMKNKEGTIHLTSDIFVPTKNADKPILVLNNDGYLLSKKFESGKVVSQGAIWNQEGLTRPYNALTSNQESHAKQPFDLVEKFQGDAKKVNVVTPLVVTTNIYQHPQAVVFIVSDAKGVLPALSELTPEQAEKYFVTGYNGTSFNPFFSKDQNTTSNKSKSEIFKNLIQQNKTNVYIINPNAFKNEGDIDQILTSIGSGKVNKSAKSDIYSTLSPIGKQLNEVKKESVVEFENSLQTQYEKLLL
ncbi:hypothetical protein DLAC_07676 [Tieghemostelium lacteum]|uniref:phosphoenolpyruvate carboxykinase (ATP) n=1 Tax=Tieghemostelium lacteum TaxID=361077 RepID=A0A151ZD38_TIELA|nr:hypothetical protein DLAC_07676 [Tieghemostelium lacteum]|eukprot:KYQ91866.1 hypothetical protein DLAC_07676 [Tieghemostelium lacteum]